MIKKLTLHNFKSIREETFEFSSFDLLVGRNNSGKSTILQALAIWQFCVDEFGRSARSGAKGIQVVLPNFTALPVPEFNLLWTNRTDRHWLQTKEGRKKQDYILVEIHVEWSLPNGETKSFGVHLRYHSPQTIYAIPSVDWKKFRDDDFIGLPKIAFVPPFSGLEPAEKWMDISPVRQQIGKGQPGSVLRNLLLKVYRPDKDVIAKGYKVPAAWEELVKVVREWFSVDLLPPDYTSGKDVNITVEYRKNGKNYDIISGGSGFHQTLTLLAFLYGYRPTTILLDEPDAHLHVNLQRQILDYFQKKSSETGTQFLIATHAEALIHGVDPSRIMSLLGQKPNRIQSTPAIIKAMADVSNEEITRLMESPYILYVEGESDERILRAWAEACDATEALNKFCFHIMRGGSKDNMKKRADDHFGAVRHIVHKAARKILFDYDDASRAYHPKAGDPHMTEWRRKNIENYLLVPDVWRRSVSKIMGGDLLAYRLIKIIDDFFSGQNLTLPASQTWRAVTADIFNAVNGKKILFENEDSLFHRLVKENPAVKLTRDYVAMNMLADEIHEDVHQFLGALASLAGASKT